MQTRIAQYLNEIVSLTMLALLALALITGQAGAAADVHDVVGDASDVIAELSFSIRLEGE